MHHLALLLWLLPALGLASPITISAKRPPGVGPVTVGAPLLVEGEPVGEVVAVDGDTITLTLRVPAHQDAHLRITADPTPKLELALGEAPARLLDGATLSCERVASVAAPTALPGCQENGCTAPDLAPPRFPRLRPEGEAEVEAEVGQDENPSKRAEDALFDAPVENEPPLNEPQINEPSLDDATLTLGGRLLLRLDATISQEVAAADTPLSSENLLDVYLDARPRPGLRAYARGRFTYEPTTAKAWALDPEPAQHAALDQLWLSGDLGRQVFLTAGLKPARWGVGRVFTPADLLNRTRKDPLSPLDLRRGIPLVRARLPVEALGGSVEALALLEGATTVDQVGGGLRAEIALPRAELALAAVARRDSPKALSVELSAGWLPGVDLYAEAVAAYDDARVRYRGPFSVARLWDALAGDPAAAPTAVDEDDWTFRGLVGLECPIPRVPEVEALHLGAEYAFDTAGVDDPTLYPYLAAQEQLTAFALARHYAAVYGLVSRPFGWSLEALITGIANVSDGSAVARADLTFETEGGLFLTPYLAGRFGDVGDELRYGVTLPPFPTPVEGDDSAPLYAGETFPAPRLELGLWIRAEL